MSPRVKDDWLEVIDEFKSLKILDASLCGITGSGFRNVTNLKNLSVLDLSFNKVGDEGIQA